MSSTKHKTCPLCTLKNKREKRSNIILQYPKKSATIHELDIEAKQFIVEEEE